MMEPFERIDIQELPLSVPSFRHQVEDFLGSNGLRIGEVDLYMAVLSEDGSILAGGGLQRDIIKCLAVSPAARSLGLSVPLVSRLISVAADRGFTNVKVFTKPENLALFESFGFKLLASAPKAILLENGRGLEDYCAYLRGHRAEGVIVMNANPFTRGHRYLVEQAAMSFRAPEGGRNLCVIPVKEDVSRFPFGERIDMIRRGSEKLADVVDGSDYQISAATFPTYFMKDLSDAAETQMRLDIDLFGRHIAPALGATVRFVGSEPSDSLTARYNALMKELLPSYGIQVVEIKRLKGSNGRFIKASRVRELLDQGRFREAAALTPASTHPYLLADLAARALRMELDTPLKPGLVGPDSRGAHGDMTYTLMLKGIEAFRPFFPRMAQASSAEELRALGIYAEKAMLTATGSVNTHRGAIFALGLALFASNRRMEVADSKEDIQCCLSEIAQAIVDNSLIDKELHSTPQSHGSVAVAKYGVKGAREMAREGYRDLFERWLPCYRSLKADAYGLQRTLLKIMSELDDTCVIHRAGYERAQAVKAEARAMLEEIAGQAGNDGKGQAGNDGKGQAGNDGKGHVGNDEDAADRICRLKEMCARFAAEGISPGGAADMLALTIFMDSILH
jgi:[citrate (pro-3S)-lyase] ligase